MASPLMVAAPDGVRLATYEFGNPAGPELVLVHGFCHCHLAFRRQLAGPLAEACRIVAFDLRGHGASDKPDDPDGYRRDETWSNDLSAVLRAREVRRPVLAGWSMGGRVVREYLIRPDRGPVAGVNFVASQVVQDPRCRGPASPKVFPPEHTMSNEIDWAIRFLEDCVHHKVPEAAFRIDLACNMMIPDPVRRAIAGWASDPARSLARLPTLDVPVLLSHGRQDRVVLPFASTLAAEHLRRAEIAWYDECGHTPFAEFPDRFDRELLGFVRRCQEATLLHR